MTSSSSSSPSTFVQVDEIDLSAYPPAPVVWLTSLIDTICTSTVVPTCANWREQLSLSSDSWFQAKVPPLTQSFPQVLSYRDFLQRSGSNKLELASLYEYAFQTPSTALGILTTPTAIAVMCLLVFFLRRIKSVLLPVFSGWGRRAALQTHGSVWVSNNAVRIDKFGEYVFRLFFHTCIALYGIAYFHDKEWWKGNTLSLFQGFPYHDIAPGMAWYYLLQGAYNLDALVSLFEMSLNVKWRRPAVVVRSTYRNPANWWRLLPITVEWKETVRGDFQEMAVHHVVTNLLVIGSSHFRLTRIGSMVFLVHDVSDVPVDLSKLANFLKWKKTTLTCFGTMVLTWMWTRLYILPFTIYGSVLTESHYVLETGLDPVLYVCYRHMFYILVGLLILLHVAWFFMFLKMLQTFLVKRECHDLSEHKKGEKDH